MPYPTMEELSFGARPVMEAIAPAVIIGDIPASKIATFVTSPLHPKSFTTTMATSGATISLIKRETLKGASSSRVRRSCNCNPTATRATGTMVFAKVANTFVISASNSTPISDKASIRAINGGKVMILKEMIFRLISLL